MQSFKPSLKRRLEEVRGQARSFAPPGNLGVTLAKGSIQHPQTAVTTAPVVPAKADKRPSPVCLAPGPAQASCTDCDDNDAHAQDIQAWVLWWVSP